MIKIKLFLLNFVLAGSQFSTSSATVLATFNEKVALGDINALKTLIDSNSKYVENPTLMKYRNDGFISAIKDGRAPVVELLLKNGNVNVAVNNNEAILLASEKGDIDIVKLLLARPEVNPGAMGNQALIRASKNGHTEVVRLLLEHPKVDPTIGGNLAFHEASSMSHGDIIKLFINDGRMNPSVFKLYTLKRAAQLGNVDLVRYLLGYSFFSQQAHLVASSGRLVSIKTLVDAGYKYDKVTLDKALGNARSRGNYETVEYLESLKGKPNLPRQNLIAMTKQCAICLSDEDLLEGFMTSCKHQFHAECLQKWIVKQNSCPMCRSSII